MKILKLILLCLIIPILSGCEVGNAAYKVYQENDVWYLEFDPEKYDELTYDYDQDNYQHFKSVSQMRRTVKYGTLSDNQLITMKGHAKNNKIELGDLDDWREIAYPRNIPYEYVRLYGPSYSFIFRDDGICNGIITISSQSRYEKELEIYTDPSAARSNKPISDKQISYRNTTAREFIYQVNTRTIKRLLYHLPGKNAELYFIETYYLQSDSSPHGDELSDSLPNEILIRGTDGKDYFYGSFYGFEQSPSAEWLMSFGLK